MDTEIVTPQAPVAAVNPAPSPAPASAPEPEPDRGPERPIVSEHAGDLSRAQLNHFCAVNDCKPDDAMTEAEYAEAHKRFLNARI